MSASSIWRLHCRWRWPNYIKAYAIWYKDVKLTVNDNFLRDSLPHSLFFCPGSCSQCDFCQNVLYVQTPTTTTSRHPYSFVCWLKVFYFGVFMLVLNTAVWAFSATASTFWVTPVALAMWCNAQILSDVPCFRFAKLKRFIRLVRKKSISFLVGECLRSMWKHP